MSPPLRSSGTSTRWSTRSRLWTATIRSGSATDLLLRILPGTPVLTVDGAAALIGRTFKPANDAVERLTSAGILRQVTVGRRNRAFEAPDVIAAFTALERQMSSPDGATKTSPADAPGPATFR